MNIHVCRWCCLGIGTNGKFNERYETFLFYCVAPGGSPNSPTRLWRSPHSRILFRCRENECLSTFQDKSPNILFHSSVTLHPNLLKNPHGKARNKELPPDLQILIRCHNWRPNFPPPWQRHDKGPPAGEYFSQFLATLRWFYWLDSSTLNPSLWGDEEKFSRNHFIHSLSASMVSILESTISPPGKMRSSRIFLRRRGRGPRDLGNKRTARRQTLFKKGWKKRFNQF